MIILDIDNCVSNDEWRIPRINWHQQDSIARYRDYHLLSGFDHLHNAHLFLDKPGQVIVSTARPVLYRALTVEWLRRAGVNFRHLLMRNNDDFRRSVDVKRQHVAWLPSLYGVELQQIEAAYDDHAEVVAMYLEQGLNAQLVAIHNTSAYINPLERTAS